MLKQFLYLNESALNDYLSALEDGSRQSVEDRQLKGGSVRGKAGVPVLSGEGEKSHEAEETVSKIDTPSARFERLTRLAADDPELSGWVEIADPDGNFRDIGIGALIEVECEVYVPSMIQSLSAKGGIGQLVDTMQAMAPLMAAMGKQVDNLPSADQLGAAKNLAEAMGDDIVFVGEPLESEWRVAGKLLGDSLRAEIEGYAKVVGKVSSRVAAGSYKPLLAIPGMNLMNREKRREMEKTGPKNPDDETWLRGPALMLDVLAIYR